MRPFTRSLYRAGLIGGAALALSFAPMNARGQQVSTQTGASTETTATGQQNANPDLRNWELARMDQFLDDHQDINKDLTAKPSLINDQKYLAQHRDLQLFLSNHPQVREEFAESPTFFMNRENRFETSAIDRNQDRARSTNGRNPNPDLRNWELARMDQFLDDHQQIDQQLAANPSLINNQNYLAQHQDLKLFLSQHPQVREEFTENPTFFMNQEKRFDTQEELRSRTGQNVGQTNGNTNPDRDRDVTNTQNAVNNNPDRDQDRDRNSTDRDQDRARNANGQNPNPDLRNWEVARMDQFLDDHQQIDQQLAANPSLINNQNYLAQHQDLKLFLSNHPQVREEFAENPTFFMNQERRFETSAMDRDQDRARSTNGRNPNPDLRNWELARMDQFLDDHQQIDQQLAANPSLINNQNYLAQHQDLKLFLSQHPQVREEFTENPTFFMNQEKRFDTQEELRSRTGQNVGQTNGNTNPDRDRDVTNPQNAVNNNPDRDQDRDRTFTDRDRDRDQNPNPDLRNWELARMDQFLDDHQQIDKELTAKPSLINNLKYLSQHKDLEMFLNEHPQVREEFGENPTYFMSRERRFDAREDFRTGQTNRNTNPDRDQNRDRTFTDRDRDRDQNPNPDLRNWELARMDQFLDDHQQINKELMAKPSLINDQKYLSQHKDLQLFMNDHPQVREEFAENPTYFMNRENRFDSREFGERTDVDRNYSRSNSNVSDKQAKQMDQFLDKHKDIDRDLAKNPSLCNDDKYLKHHKDLRAFLDKNPEVRTQVSSNTAYFTRRHERMEEHGPVKKPAPAKTPIEQHETTTPAAATH